MRWSLASMFIATAFIAVAAWAAHYGVMTHYALALLAVFPLVGAAVGTLAGRVGLWVCVGVAIDIPIGLALGWIG